MAAQASLFDIDQLIGYINIPSLNESASGSDTQFGTRNQFIPSPSTFLLGAPDFSVLSSTFNNGLVSSLDNKHYTGGSFGWTVFNRGPVTLKAIQFSILLDAGLSDGNNNVIMTGGGSAGEYFEISSFKTGLSDVIGRLVTRGTPPNDGSLRTLVTIDPEDEKDTMLYALGVDIGSLEINQGFQITYRFGDTGLFGKNADGSNVFYLDVDAPRFVPEPGSLAMISLGLFAFLTTRRRQPAARAYSN